MEVQDWGEREVFWLGTGKEGVGRKASGRAGCLCAGPPGWPGELGTLLSPELWDWRYGGEPVLNVTHNSLF
jgi:hypothetical protein